MIDSNPGYRSTQILPVGQSYPPVSAGELPTFDYQVSIEITAEDAASHLEEHPEIPGVILVNGNKIHSMIPRNRMFERLGHRYGVELFLQRPIIELQENLGTTASIISSNTRISTAINVALNRNAGAIYDPLVIEYEDGSLRMVDMHTLLMAQSLVLENMNDIVSNMNRIEQSIKADIPIDTSFNMIVDAIKRTTPHHRTALLLIPDTLLKISSHHELLHPISEPLNRHPVLRSIFESRRHIHIEDVKKTPAWQGLEFLGRSSVWMGLPIASGRNFDGILSLSRTTNTPFNKNELDMAGIFAEFLSIAIHKSTNEHESRKFEEIIRRKFITD